MPAFKFGPQARDVINSVPMLHARKFVPAVILAVSHLDRLITHYETVIHDIARLVFDGDVFKRVLGTQSLGRA